MRKFLRGLGWVLMASQFYGFCFDVVTSRPILWGSNMAAFLVSLFIRLAPVALGFFLIHIEDK